MCGGQQSGVRVLFRVPFVVPRREFPHCCPVKNGEKEKRCKSVGFPTNVCSIATYFFEFNYIVIYEGGKTECVPFFHFFRSRSQREDNGCVRTCGEALSHIYIGQKRKGNTKLSRTHGKAKWGEGEIEFRTAAGKTPRGGLERKGVTFFLIVWSVSYFLFFAGETRNWTKNERSGGFLLFMAWVVYEKEGQAFFASKLRGNDDIHTRDNLDLVLRRTIWNKYFIF